MSEPARIHVVDHRASTSDSNRSIALHDTERFIRRYVHMTEAQSCTVALWTAHTYCIDAAECSPYLHVSGPKRTGKTRLLEVLELLVRNPLRTADVTEAALFHLPSEGPRTLLLDEIDTVFGGGRKREPLRALLNASYRRGTPVQRVRGNTVESYDVFGPKIIAGIGELPDTVADRSIPVRMVRKREGLDVEPFYYRDAEGEAVRIADELARCFGPTYANRTFMRTLTDARPARGDWLNDRQADSWEPLFAVAEVVGGGWDDRVRASSHELHGVGLTAYR